METAAPTDAQLLADWLAHRRESAFHALVSRYAALVHMAAKRACDDDSLAAEASQLTFILLARKAKSLSSRSSLGGWLHLTAVGEAKNLLRSSRRESRKRALLHTAMEIHPHSQPGDAWQEMQPFLNDALAALSDKDREALLLRFYRSLSVREIGATLGIATDAAQKRIDRATERLREKLARRGIQTGGSLSAAMVAGFAADAQAVVLPVSVIATKAIAAGAVGSFSLTALLATTAALMKSSPLIPPVVALILAGVWTGTKYQSLSATEARNTLLQDEIAMARSTRTPATIKLTKAEGPINWQKLATEEENGPETQRFASRMNSMTRDEMIAALDQIAALGLLRARRDELEFIVVMPLMRMDPEWVLNRFVDRLSDSDQPLRLASALHLWAKRDLGKATAWFDARIAAGDFNSKKLAENDERQSRHEFESGVIHVMLDSDPAAASRRLCAFPEKQQQWVLWELSHSMRDTSLGEGNHLAFANLVRSQLPAEIQTSVLLEGHSVAVGQDAGLAEFTAYMDKIEATPAERISCIEQASGSFIRTQSYRGKITLDDLETIRGYFGEIAPPNVDAMTARSLATAVEFPQASEIAVKYMETSGSDAVLAAWLEIAKFDEPDKKLGRELAAKITDETRRAAILKRFY